MEILSRGESEGENNRDVRMRKSIKKVHQPTLRQGQGLGRERWLSCIQIHTFSRQKDFCSDFSGQSEIERQPWSEPNFFFFFLTIERVNTCTLHVDNSYFFLNQLGFTWRPNHYPQEQKHILSI